MSSCPHSELETTLWSRLRSPNRPAAASSRLCLATPIIETSAELGRVVATPTPKHGRVSACPYHREGENNARNMGVAVRSIAKLFPRPWHVLTRSLEPYLAWNRNGTCDVEKTQFSHFYVVACKHIRDHSQLRCKGAFQIKHSQASRAEEVGNVSSCIISKSAVPRHPACLFRVYV